MVKVISCQVWGPGYAAEERLHVPWDRKQGLRQAWLQGRYGVSVTLRFKVYLNLPKPTFL